MVLSLLLSLCGDGVSRTVYNEFIQPGKPTQNSLIERFNRTFRQDVLDSYMFDSLPEIRKYADAWAWMYNIERPHSSLGQLTPTEFLLKYGKLSEFPTFQ